MMRRAFLHALVAVFTAVFGSEALGASARSKNEEANRLYLEKKYDAALKRYTEAQLESPDAPQLHYNLGNVLFRQGELEKARDEYRRALAAGDRSLEPQAVYNLGNAFLFQEQYRDAISAYQRALRLDPGDLAAKRNLELALLRMKREQQREQTPDGGKKDPEDRKPSSAEKADALSKPESGRPEGGPSPEAQKGSNPSGGEKKARGSLTREEAERILEALQEDEKANMKKRLQAARKEPERVDQDW